MPSWWPFGTSQEPSRKETSLFDAAVPPPPSGAFVPLPEAPKALRTSQVGEFKGFTPPPLSSSSIETHTASSNSSLFSGFKSKSPTNYQDEDFSSYTSSIKETPGFNDHLAPLGFADRYLTNPRARNCFESVKMGVKMGCSVGAIFGGLTGIYTSIAHRNVLLFPLSLMGGGVSFGFFLGCGMLVRCDGGKMQRV